MIDDHEKVLSILQENYEAAKRIKLNEYAIRDFRNENPSSLELLLETYEDLISIFNKGDESQQVSKEDWISVEERLPDYDTLVLWIDESCHQFVSEIDHDSDFQNFQSWNKGWDDKIIKITHWMPLPKPPNTE